MKIAGGQGKPGAPLDRQATHMSMSTLRLGLIGDNIAQSLSPRLHFLAGEQHGLKVSYERLIPAERGARFDEILNDCRASGYRGVNITYPYKEAVAELVSIPDPQVRAIGAVNTVLFEPGGPVGHNTDYTGFKAAYRAARPHAKPGTILLIGAGGVGRAVAFALADLGADKLVLCDRDMSKAESLGQDLKRSGLEIVCAGDPIVAATGVTGLINCTPVGMVGFEGTPLPKHAMDGAEWAFDAVYTPKNTQFLTGAAQMGLTCITGWELFFHQGIDAWSLFSERPVTPAALKADLRHSGDIS